MSGRTAPAGAGDGSPTPPAPVEKVRAFDIRTVIGALLGVYGVVLLVMGLFFTSAEDLAKADGENLNLWTGLGLLVAAGVFLLWVRLRPLEVPVPQHDSGAVGGDAVRDGASR